MMIEHYTFSDDISKRKKRQAGNLLLSKHFFLLHNCKYVILSLNDKIIVYFINFCLLYIKRENKYIYALVQATLLTSSTKKMLFNSLYNFFY